ncbi:hypothetical protein HPP92_020927 [Vanilla planifolia]|uniref:Uncharacterized protein n=1 Tax=Vanilla planifolia TaxID=51239 RepID=A0A835UH31_VANPL|nr:hypothetical protein HPP92_020927 [Vanilla planifolia]
MGKEDLKQQQSLQARETWAKMGLWAARRLSCGQKKKYQQRRHLVDVTEIFNQLHGEKKRRLIKLIYLVFLLFLSLFWMIWSVLDDE